jgi:hypothetical protein
MVQGGDMRVFKFKMMTLSERGLNIVGYWIEERG